MNLQQALRADSQTRLAFVGAGGKTTAMFQLAHQLDAPVLVTASTHLGMWQAAGADQHFIATSPDDIRALRAFISGVTLLTGPTGQHDRLDGLDETSLAAVLALAEELGCPLLVEADGSRQRPLKAPADHEPAIPSWVRQVVVTVGLSSLGQPLDETTIHRPDRFAALTGLDMRVAIEGKAIQSVLLHPQGGLKNIPNDARAVALLNQVDTLDLQAQAEAIAQNLLPAYHAVVVASLQSETIHSVFEPTAAVILAGGDSTRFGAPKALLDWQGRPLIRHVTETAIQSGLSPVIVVLGAVDAPIRASLEGLNITIVKNAYWQQGQSTSVRIGVEAVQRSRAAAAAFLLADQPFVTPELIQALLDSHRHTLAPVTAPQVNGRRANPVFFDRLTFPDLLQLSGDVGGRAVFQKYPPHFVSWPDERLLFDIDTPEDYQRAIALG